MLTSVKIRLYHTCHQKEMLAQHYGCVRYVYNNCLQHKQNVYNETKKNLSKFDLINYITTLKKDTNHQWLNEVKAEILQNGLDGLEQAFKRFFKGIADFPKFKKKSNKQSFKTKQNFKFCFNTNKIVFFSEKIKFKCSKADKEKLMLAASNNPDRLELKDHNKTYIKYITFSKDVDNTYYASITFDDTTYKCYDKLPDDKAIALDLGIRSFITFNDGSKINNPFFYKKEMSKIAKMQAALNHKKLINKAKEAKENAIKKAKIKELKANGLYTKEMEDNDLALEEANKYKQHINQEKLQLKINKRYKSITNKKKHFLYQIANKITNENQNIYLEDLNIKSMLENDDDSDHHRNIADSSWGLFVSLLKEKAKQKNRTIIQVDQYFPSSKLCSHCSYKHNELKRGDKIFKCPSCCFVEDRDVNAAINILKEGNRIRAELPL